MTTTPTSSPFGRRSFDPSRERSMDVSAPALDALLWQHPGACATVSEYAAAAGLSTDEVLDEFGPYLEDGTVSLEVVGDELFVMTAPQGRPAPATHADVHPNLWERLRDRESTHVAYSLWRLIRALERAGWAVETAPGTVRSGLGPLADGPFIGVYVRHTVVPLLAFPELDALADADGPLSDLERAGAAAIAVTCDNGALGEAITAVRGWMLSRALLPSMSVLVLESPRYAPTMLRPTDSSITPVSVTHALPGDLA